MEKRQVERKTTCGDSVLDIKEVKKSTGLPFHTEMKIANVDHKPSLHDG